MGRLLLFVGALVTLCVSSAGAAASNESPQAEPPQGVEAWIGTNEETLRASWGKPTRTKKLSGGGRLLVYKIEVHDGTAVVPGMMIPYMLSDMEEGQDPFTDPWNDRRLASDAVSLRTPPTADSHLATRVKVKFRIDAEGTVIDATMSGTRNKTGTRQ